MASHLPAYSSDVEDWKWGLQANGSHCVPEEVSWSRGQYVKDLFVHRRTFALYYIYYWVDCSTSPTTASGDWSRVQSIEVQGLKPCWGFTGYLEGYLFLHWVQHYYCIPFVMLPRPAVQRNTVLYINGCAVQTFSSIFHSMSRSGPQVRSTGCKLHMLPLIYACWNQRSLK